MIRGSAGTRERVEFGRNQRQKLKRSDHAHWDATQRKQNPVENYSGGEPGTDCFAGADQDGADGGVAVRILSRECAGDGGGSGGDAL